MATIADILRPGQPEIIAVHPDWITATAKDPVKRDALRGLCFDQIQQQAKSGAEWSQWSFQGFEGVHCGQVTFGDRERDDCSIVRLSGGLAGSLWREVSKYSNNCSRFDLAVTVRMNRYMGDLAALGYEQACAAANLRGEGLHVSLIVSNYGGGTCYLGSRSSPLFGRLYDKERESNDGAYKDCWRWEVECKGKRALTYLHQLAIGDDERPVIQRAVGDYFTQRGISLPWDPGSSCGLRGPVLVETDDERRLAWLSDQVRASVRGLIGRGHREAVLEALELLEGPDRPIRDALGDPEPKIERNQAEITL